MKRLLDLVPDCIALPAVGAVLLLGAFVDEIARRRDRKRRGWR